MKTLARPRRQLLGLYLEYWRCARTALVGIVAGRCSLS